MSRTTRQTRYGSIARGIPPFLKGIRVIHDDCLSYIIGGECGGPGTWSPERGGGLQHCRAQQITIQPLVFKYPRNIDILRMSTWSESPPTDVQYTRECLGQLGVMLRWLPSCPHRGHTVWTEEYSDAFLESWQPTIQPQFKVSK